MMIFFNVVDCAVDFYNTSKRITGDEALALMLEEICKFKI
jgi:hypothetical protein